MPALPAPPESQPLPPPAAAATGAALTEDPPQSNGQGDVGEGHGGSAVTELDDLAEFGSPTGAEQRLKPLTLRYNSDQPTEPPDARAQVPLSGAPATQPHLSQWRAAVCVRAAPHGPRACPPLCPPERAPNVPSCQQLPSPPGERTPLTGSSRPAAVGHTSYASAGGQYALKPAPSYASGGGRAQPSQELQSARSAAGGRRSNNGDPRGTCGAPAAAARSSVGLAVGSMVGGERVLSLKQVRAQSWSMPL